MDKGLAAGLEIVNSKPSMTPISSPVSGNRDDEVRVVSLTEWKEAALSLAIAFKEDETAHYFVNTPDRAHWTEKQKWDLHVQIMEYVTYAHLLTGLVTSIGPNYSAVALWMPPGKNMDDPFTVMRSGMWRLYYQLSREGKQRFFKEFMPLLHSTKSEVMGARDGESWYLVYIGSKPEARGKGYSRKLVEYITKMADQEGRACYLESTNPVNVAIYQKFGFEKVDGIALNRAEQPLKLDIMVREPKTE